MNERWQIEVAAPIRQTNTIPQRRRFMMAIATLHAHSNAPKTELSWAQIWTPIWQGKPLHAFSFYLPSPLLQVNSFNFPYLLASKLAGLGIEREIENELSRTGLLSPSSALPASIVAGPARFLIANPIFAYAGHIVPTLPASMRTGTPTHDLQALVADIRAALIRMNCINGGHHV